MTPTDAEAIARDLNAATSLVIEQMYEAGHPISMREGETTWRTYHAGFDLSLFAQRITDACCDAILSYLASRRESQEPVAHPKIMYVCECCYEHNPEMCGYDRRDIYVTPDGKWLCDGCIDAEDIPSRDCVSPPLLYTAPPPPAGEVERLVKPIIDRLEWNGRLQQWVVRPDLPAGTINAVRVALNGGRSE